MLVVARDHRVVAGGDTYRADELAARVPARAWQQISCGKGAKGHRFYDWAFIRLDHDGLGPTGQAAQRWLLVRRNQRTGELAFYRCFVPRPVPLAVLVRVAGRAGAPGTAGPRWRCSPTPSWSWPPWPNGPATQHRQG